MAAAMQATSSHASTLMRVMKTNACAMVGSE